MFQKVSKKSGIWPYQTRTQPLWGSGSAREQASSVPSAILWRGCLLSLGLTCKARCHFGRIGGKQPRHRICGSQRLGVVGADVLGG